MKVRFAMVVVFILPIIQAYNGDLTELACPDECHCHYFRINWVVDCSDSNLTEIPYEELDISVYVLDMNSNKITQLKPFPQDIKIRRLQLADNLITDIHKEPFAGLNYLIDADLADNRITRVDPNTFEDSTGLNTLELQGNPLGPVPGSFLISKSLFYLDISSCGLTHLNSDFFSNITTLNTLDLCNNPIGKIDNAVFEPLVSLETLKMHNCNLTYIANTAFHSQTNLKTLELSENMLTNLDWPQVIGHLIRLEYLDLRNSRVRDIPDATFYNSTYLRTLILAQNELIEVDVASTLGENLYELDTLDLSYCNLNKPLSEDAFINSTKLRVLILSGNTLFASDLLVALAPLVGLQKLSLSNCGLSRLPDTFHKFKGLRELDISHNPLNDVFMKLLSPLHTLEYLNMGYSNLSYLSPASFSKMTSMKRLILSGNDLNSLEAGLFGGLTHLESLELNHCGLRRPINATAFFNNLTYTDLTELQLAGNPLRVSKTGPLLPRQFSRLQTLDLSNCNLTYLPFEAFHWSRNITNLMLMGNQFGTPEDLQFLHLLPELKILDLRYNNLSSLSPKYISANINIEKLKLIGNPWKCNCSIAELWDWAHIQKGDLSILEGSTVDAEQITAGKSKKKKLLVCAYDASVQLPIVMNKTATGRKPFTNPGRLLTQANRTWAKYVRESGCDLTATLDRPIRSVDVESTNENPVSKFDGTSTWVVALMNAAILYILIMALVLVMYIINYREKLANLRKVTAELKEH